MVDKVVVTIMFLMFQPAGEEKLQNSWDLFRTYQGLGLAGDNVDVTIRRSLIFVNLIELILFDVNKYSSSCIHFE